LLRSAAALCDNDIPLAETLLRAHLREHPTDVAAIRMLAEGRGFGSGRLYRCRGPALRAAWSSRPALSKARAHYATVLNRQKPAHRGPGRT